MPGRAGSPYWAAVDFDSEEEEEVQTNNRVYVDPWDNDAYGIMEAEESSNCDNFNSYVGEPVSASFYYVPTKTYDSGEEPHVIQRHELTPPHDSRNPEYSLYSRKPSRVLVPDIHHDMGIYADKPKHRRRSMYIEEPVYIPQPLLYEPLYGMIPPPGYLLPPPRSRMSLQHHPEYIMANLGYGKHRRHSRLTDAYEHFAYESLSPDYEDWARPYPKTAPDNFHLSRYGHLQIDYSCSWNSLDRLIRNQVP